MSPTFTANWYAVPRYTPDGSVSSRKRAKLRGGRNGVKCARVFGTMGRAAARIAANDYVRDKHVPERWRKVFTAAFIKAAIKVGR